MRDYRRSYWKTIIVVACSATGALLVDALSARAMSGTHALGFWSWLTWLLLSLSTTVMLAWAGLILLGGFLSLHRDALQARGVSYAPRQPRERPIGPVRRLVRAPLRVFARADGERKWTGLEPGDEVEVRRLDEILATLDDRGTLEGLPFMPEMVAFCGKRFRVFRRVDKLNDWVDHTGLRRVRDTVLLEGLHCDGAGHDGCQARCHIRWNEAWLKRPTNAAKDNVDSRAVGSPTGRRELDIATCARRSA